jgi:4-hydroxy-tetrahydrodipicolinate synthase
MFEGSNVALITPMSADGNVDTEALVRLVDRQIELGSHGLVPVGTTGESPVLSTDEQYRVVEVVVAAARGRVPVIAGCGSNNTAQALALHRHAFDAGANAALHVTGYYNRPSQEGIFRHFESLASANNLPIIVYNIPARAVVDIEVETMVRLSKLTNVVGVKDATKDLNRPVLERLAIDKPFAWLSGEDGTAVAYNAAGGVGCISTTANVAPVQCAAIQRACRDNDYALAARLQRQLMPLHQALFLEPSPAGAKYACARLGLCEETVRLPMVPLQRQTKYQIDQAMDKLELQVEVSV